MIVITFIFNIKSDFHLFISTSPCFYKSLIYLQAYHCIFIRNNENNVLYFQFSVFFKKYFLKNIFFKLNQTYFNSYFLFSLKMKIENSQTKHILSFFKELFHFNVLKNIFIHHYFIFLHTYLLKKKTFVLIIPF